MRNLIKYSGIALMMAFGVQTQAQEVEVNVLQVGEESRFLPNFRPPNQHGINVFEPAKDTADYFDGIKVVVGGDFAIQFQGLDHENAGSWIDPTGATQTLGEIGSNFNLPTANLDIDVLLYDGVRMHLRTYLSSRHHPEPYVKDGYIQIDKLDFISEGFMSGFMNHARIKIGHMENNYGDAHFRRTDNAAALYNPFVGNLIMDSFTTEVGGELYYFNQGFLGMIGATNGKLNQSVANPDDAGVSWLGKIGYDTDLNDDFRFRLTGSVYHTNKVPSAYLYGADRAGSRYYGIMGEGFTSGRYNPKFGNEITSYMVNPFIKLGGLEFFGTYEQTSGKQHGETDERAFTQLAGDLIYRFGPTENFYVGGRYNTLSGDDSSGADIDINRFQIAGGWFLNKNIMTKVEYVSQNYEGFNLGSQFDEGQFSGLMIEAAISF